MTAESTLDQIAGILLRHDLTFDTLGGGHGHRITFDEHTGVFLAVRPFGPEVLVAMSSPIVTGIDLTVPAGAKALNVVSRLNASHRFMKFGIVDENILVAEYDLLGADLAAKPLMNAVLLISDASRRVGDQFACDLGGERYSAPELAERIGDDGVFG